MKKKSPARKQLVRDVKREALRRMEDAARTVEDFEQVTAQYDHLDENRERRERDHEIGRDTPLLEWGAAPGNRIIPRPLNHQWWRQLLRGDFLDAIHDCPHEMHELTDSRAISDALKTLNDNQIEVLYYWAIRQESPQRIAKRRGQTDRNILKVYATLVKGLRKKLHDRFSPLYDKGFSLTLAEKQFVEEYGSGRLKTGKVKTEKGKPKYRT